MSNISKAQFTGEPFRLPLEEERDRHAREIGATGTENAGPDLGKKEEETLCDCYVKRNSIVKSVSPDAIYIGRSPDQNPRRKVPIRSYREEKHYIGSGEGRFAVINMEPVTEPDSSAVPADHGITADINTPEKTVKPECSPVQPSNNKLRNIQAESEGIKVTVPSCYNNFPEEGYIDPGLPEI